MNESLKAAYALKCDKSWLNYDMQVQLSIVRNIIYGAVSKGADFHTLCQEVGILPQMLNASDNFIPFEKVGKAWRAALQQTRDPLVGLHLGEEMSMTILGMIGYLMQNCRTAHEALTMLTRYNNLYSTIFTFGMVTEGENTAVIYEPSVVYQNQFPESARQAVEFSMSGMLTLYGILTKKKLYPVRVEQCYPKRHVQEYERIFRSSIIFDASRNAIIYRSKDLQTPILCYDESLFAFFNSTLQQRLTSLDNATSFADKIKHALLIDFKGMIPSIDIVASHVSMTSRSLQRKLKEEGTSYREVSNGIRKEIASRIMVKPQFKIKEVAGMLGYSGPSAFRKAYKKWSNQ